MNRNQNTGTLRRTATTVFTLAGLLVAAASTGIGTGTALAGTTGPGSGPGFCKSVSAAAYTLGAAFDNVYACGPATGLGDVYDPAPNAFQCVELANRFESVVYGEPIVYANGNGVVAALHARDGVPIEGPAPGQLPAPGDVISMSQNGAAPGHVAVVTAVDAPMGNGTITVMEQNASRNGSNVIAVRNWALSYHGLFNTYTWTVQERRASGAVLMRHVGGGGYRVAPGGTITPFGGAPTLQNTATWPGHDIVRGAVLRSDDLGGYLVDLYGGVHPFGNAPNVAQNAYWPGWDIVRGITLRSDNTSGYVLDGYGGLHGFGGAPPVAVSAYWPGWDIATGVTQYDDGGGYVLDGYGGLHPFGDAAPVISTAYWRGWEIAAGVITLHGGLGPQGYILDGYGGLHPFGGAPNVAVPGYHSGLDTAVAVSLVPNGSTGMEVDTLGTLITVTGPTSGCTTCR